MIWILIIAITLLNMTIVALLLGTRKAGKGKCSSNHYLIYNVISISLLALFGTLLWLSLAVYSFGLTVNYNFCRYPYESVLDLLSGTGYGYTLFYYFTERYIEVRNRNSIKQT